MISPIRLLAYAPWNNMTVFVQAGPERVRQVGALVNEALPSSKKMALLCWSSDFDSTKRISKR